MVELFVTETICASVQCVVQLSNLHKKDVQNIASRLYKEHRKRDKVMNAFSFTAIKLRYVSVVLSTENFSSVLLYCCTYRNKIKYLPDFMVFRF